MMLLTLEVCACLWALSSTLVNVVWLIAFFVRRTDDTDAEVAEDDDVPLQQEPQNISVRRLVVPQMNTMQSVYAQSRHKVEMIKDRTNTR